ncbi:hypothetical protein CYMTET_12996 [Cymbomonas tetramitiformis]|uniref:Enoyl-CoA hydratase n=1 Tax=Cymbomonas tetramitiformis TaxID=36881 RepID=A0AAE0GJE5_9CHLO|nr:hypothetical protein CYMTET_12996 [Cymbomonas tetramitiformis]
MASNGETQDILISTAGNVSTITLNRPKRGNAITKLMATEIVSSLESMEADPSLRVIILTGAGKYFCTGMDLGGGSDIQSLSPGVDAVVGMFERVRTCSKPVIALVNGPALGGGVGLVFACDFRFALKHVFFEFSEVKRGIVPAIISTFIVPQMGPFASQQLMLSGARLSSAEAKGYGLLTEVCDGEESIAAHAKECVASLMSSAPQAMSTIKKLVRHVADNNHENGVAYAKGVFKEMMVSEEARYGITSFQKKEKPDWTSFAAKSKL